MVSEGVLVFFPVKDRKILFRILFKISNLQFLSIILQDLNVLLIEISTCTDSCRSKNHNTNLKDAPSKWSATYVFTSACLLLTSCTDSAFRIFTVRKYPFEN